jgi:hypothetical protein
VPGLTKLAGKPEIAIELKLLQSIPLLIDIRFVEDKPYPSIKRTHAVPAQHLSSHPALGGAGPATSRSPRATAKTLL